MDEILVKYLLGETSEKEEQMVKSWIAESVENEKHYTHYKLIWEESRKLGLTGHIDENAAWRRFQVLLQKKDAEKVRRNSSVNETKTRRIFLRIAAAACLFFTIGIAAYFYFTSIITISSGDQVLIKTLPDNSVITLNKNATLSYEKGFNKTGRKVTLSGEAFFNVAPDKQKPFQIEVGDAVVTVVGTSFNIKDDEEGTQVIVETGMVTVQVKNNRVKMLPHQKMVIRKGSEELVVHQNEDELYNYYRTNEFICKNTPLNQLIDALNKNFDTHIKILNAEAGKLRLTTRFEKENLDDILKILSETLDVKIEYKKDEILIK